MRRSLTLAAAVLAALTVAGPSYGQTVDEIVAKNLKAKGGAEKWKSVSSVRMTGRITLQGKELPMTLQGKELPMIVYAKRPNMSRQEFTIQDRKIVQAFDGTTPWMINPMMGDTPQEIPGPQADLARSDADFDGALMDYKAKGHVVELVGKEKVGTADVYHLKITKKGGHVQDIYLDTESGIELKTTTEMPGGGMKRTLETEMSDYKAIDGIMIPHTIKQSLNGMPVAQMTIEKVEFNAPLDDALFRMPKK